MNVLTSPMIEVPTSVPGGVSSLHLASVEAYDAVLDVDYEFVVFKEFDRTGSWRLRIRTIESIGTIFEPAMLEKSIRAAGHHRRPWFQWGYSLDPSAGYSRTIHFRVHLQDGQPSEIEIFFHVGDSGSSGGSARSVKFAYPA